MSSSKSAPHGSMASSAAVVAVLKKAVIPPPVAAGLLRKYPGIAHVLAANPYLDSSAFAGMSWGPGMVTATVPLISAVPEEVAARWADTDDHREFAVDAFLEAWIMGSDVQRKFLRERAGWLSRQNKANAVARNWFDQEIVYEFLADRTWSFQDVPVPAWLAHNPAVVDDDTFVAWLAEVVSHRDPSAPRNYARLLEEVALALTVRPHLAGVLLDKAGPVMIQAVIEVDAPGNVDRLMNLVSDGAQMGSGDRAQALCRLAWHPGLDAGLRADLWSRFEGQVLAMADGSVPSDGPYRGRIPDLSRVPHIGEVLVDVPSGSPADYPSDVVASAVRFYNTVQLYETAMSRRIMSADSGSGRLPGPPPVPVDVLEGLAVAAIRFQATAPELGPAVYGLLGQNHVWSNTGASHRLIGLRQSLADTSPGLAPYTGAACGTHRAGHVPPPGSVLKSTARTIPPPPPAPSDTWPTVGALTIGVVRDLDHTETPVTAANLGRYLSFRLGSAVDDTDRWEAFLHLLGSLHESALLREVADLALALQSAPAK